MSRHRRRDRRGQSAVEMALVLPLLLLLLMGIFEVGRAWNVKQVVTDAARDGARHAVVQHPLVNPDSVTAVMLGALNRSSIPSAVATLEFDSFPPPVGHWREMGALQTVYVGVDYQFRFLGPLFKAVFGSESITISSEVTMRNE